ncbi:hypothetical protein ML401_23625 [Bradyrhizobium sp. 62B]|uniref:hypothetical protein n=1 Tax=Bradyrhizobium sp. 62B TaxID=2898442 RepID=UPI002557ECDA|nr:hypothetical protein ML401_23625 [Bradyrhizobium sp. 62B]
MPEAMIIGCRRTRTSEIDPSNLARLINQAKEADAVVMDPGLSTRHLANCEPSSSIATSTNRSRAHAVALFAARMLDAWGGMEHEDR